MGPYFRLLTVVAFLGTTIVSFVLLNLASIGLLSLRPSTDVEDDYLISLGALLVLEAFIIVGSLLLGTRVARAATSRLPVENRNQKG